MILYYKIYFQKQLQKLKFKIVDLIFKHIASVQRRPEIDEEDCSVAYQRTHPNDYGDIILHNSLGYKAYIPTSRYKYFNISFDDVITDTCFVKYIVLCKESRTQIYIIDLQRLHTFVTLHNTYNNCYGVDRYVYL